MATAREESKLKRNITFWPLMGICYGQIIGAGIMTNTGIAIGMTGTGVALAYAISALCTLFQNYPSAILGACLPITGGSSVFPLPGTKLYATHTQLQLASVTQPQNAGGGSEAR